MNSAYNEAFIPKILSILMFMNNTKCDLFSDTLYDKCCRNCQELTMQYISWLNRNSISKFRSFVVFRRGEQRQLYKTFQPHLGCLNLAAKQ